MIKNPLAYTRHILENIDLTIAFVKEYGEEKILKEPMLFY